MSITFDDLKTGKVKLEFGNLEQIACIDSRIRELERQAELDEIVENDEILKEYEVEYLVAGTAYFTVEAYSEDEARDKAETDKPCSYFDLDAVDLDWDVHTLKLVGRA